MKNLCKFCFLFLLLNFAKADTISAEKTIRAMLADKFRDYDARSAAVARNLTYYQRGDAGSSIIVVCKEVGEAKGFSTELAMFLNKALRKNTMDKLGVDKNAISNFLTILKKEEKILKDACSTGNVSKEEIASLKMKHDSVSQEMTNWIRGNQSAYESVFGETAIEEGSIFIDQIL